MYKEVKKLHQAPKLDNLVFEYEFDPYCLGTQPNLKVKNFDEFQQALIKGIVENERCTLEDFQYDIEDDPDIINKEPYQYTLHCLGEDKFLEEVGRLYCTPLNGNWRNIYINLSPYFINSKEHYSQVKFETTPSIAEILYAHSCIWQKFYKQQKENVEKINHHYSTITFLGDRYNLICDICCDS